MIRISKSWRGDAEHLIVHEFDGTEEAWRYVVSDVRLSQKNCLPYEKGYGGSKVSLSAIFGSLFGGKAHGRCTVQFCGEDSPFWAVYASESYDERPCKACGLCARLMACERARERGYGGCSVYACIPEADLCAVSDKQPPKTT